MSNTVLREIDQMWQDERFAPAQSLTLQWVVNGSRCSSPT